MVEFRDMRVESPGKRILPLDTNGAALSGGAVARFNSDSSWLHSAPLGFLFGTVNDGTQACESCQSQIDGSSAAFGNDFEKFLLRTGAGACFTAVRRQDDDVGEFAGVKRLCTGAG
jgi:hypothetical protein